MTSKFALSVRMAMPPQPPKAPGEPPRPSLDIRIITPPHIRVPEQGPGKPPEEPEIRVPDEWDQWFPWEMPPPPRPEDQAALM